MKRRMKGKIRRNRTIGSFFRCTVDIAEQILWMEIYQRGIESGFIQRRRGYVWKPYQATAG